MPIEAWSREALKSFPWSKYTSHVMFVHLLSEREGFVFQIHLRMSRMHYSIQVHVSSWSYCEKCSKDKLDMLDKDKLQYSAKYATAQYLTLRIRNFYSSSVYSIHFVTKLARDLQRCFESGKMSTHKLTNMLHAPCRKRNSENVEVRPSVNIFYKPYPPLFAFSHPFKPFGNIW